MAKGQAYPGALSRNYTVPAVRFRHPPLALAVPITFAVLAGMATHHFLAFPGARTWQDFAPWAVSFGVMALQWVISWWDRPWTVYPDQLGWLDQLRVMVAIPVYNEDPALLDRCLWALVNQSRPPQRVHVVDDGSKTDYTLLRAHWEGHWGATEVVWTRQQNAGKKWAQAAAFAADTRADIIITIDSDTCLERNAIHEGLKPFVNRRVASVAGHELVHNARANWLTRSVSARNMVYQLVTWGAQSVTGDVLVNRGPFALYRGWIIREIIPAYVHETFLGHRIKLGDDAALTLFSRARGKTVQQPTAFAFAVHPETFSHHFRQWTRWMRGSIIRDCWRIRYLPMLSYGWLWTVVRNWAFLASPALPALIVLGWPATAQAVAWIIVTSLAWSSVLAVRMFAIKRSDESLRFRLVTYLMHPVAVLWAMLILRWIRFYGLATFLRQGWVTRGDGVEVTLNSSTEAVKAR